MKVCPTCGEAYGDDLANCPRDGAVLRAVQDPLVGRTVGGRYRLISRLGAGGMSAVYLARHVLIDRLVAVKTLRRDLAQDPVQRDRFIREARAVNRVNHQNIVEITDFGETDDGLVYLVMEYVAGDSLLRVIGSDAPFEPMRALHIAEQTASALGRAHQMGIVHRDLKPENVLVVRRKDGRDFVKLLDFGIAKILDAPSLTGSQQIFGTPGYIAPEYIQSTAIDGRADLYSLGVLMYEMVTGALPFDYEYPGDLLVKHVTEQPIPPSEREPTVEPALEKLILRALEKDPARRFRDAYHFLEELRLARERLGGPASWGGLSEKPAAREDSDPDVVMPKVDEVVHRALLRETDSAGLVYDDRTEVAPPELPEDDEPRRDTLLDVDRPIPPPPPMVARTPSTGDQGLLGVRRWRARFEALDAAVAQLLCTEPTVLDDLAFALEVLENLESGVATAEAAQREIDSLGEAARDFRATLGRAIDQLAVKLSKARGVLEELARRRDELRETRESETARVRDGVGDEGRADALLWELATVEQALRTHAQETDELEAQLAELRVQLEAHNEEVEEKHMSLVTTADVEMIRLDALAAALRLPLERVQQYVERAWNEGAVPRLA
ncbi:MAG: protein kinase [Sandaracinus sp.]|nr:protein kinase [Sandaracinus sp.]MCB9620961.1 protein kinase [Sandaracinus sp.]MCB9635755.1 protein kinase [Sandaracinus sp.]